MKQNLLITAGATREYLDGVRYLSNISTGLTGALLADQFYEAGFEVTYLHGEGSVEPRCNVATSAFRDYSDLNARLQDLLSRTRYCAAIHLAAVSDYSIAELLINGRSTQPGKMKKIDSGEEIALKLKINPKIVDQLKRYSANPEILVIAFKLTNDPDAGARRTAACKLANQPNIDFVVHNDLSEIRNDHQHVFSIYQKENLLTTVASVPALSTELLKVLKEGVL